MVDGFIASVLGSLAVKYLPAFMRRRPKTREASAAGTAPPAETSPSSGQPGPLECAARSETEAAMAAFLLRAAVNSTDGKIRCAGRVAQSSHGPHPMGPMSIRIGGESIRSSTAAQAIQFASAVDLLHRRRCVAHVWQNGDLIDYAITAIGVAEDSRTTFVHREAPRDEIPRTW